MKQSLFHEDGDYTLQANDISREFDNVIRAIFQKHIEKYSVRELELIASHSVSMMSCEALLNLRSIKENERKAEMLKNLSDPELANKVRKCVKSNFPNTTSHKIAAIKSLRELTGILLVDAKNWVEANMAEFQNEKQK